MRIWIVGFALALFVGSVNAGEALPANVAQMGIVNTAGESPLAELGFDSKVIFGKFVSQLEKAHPGEVKIKHKDQTYIVEEKDTAVLFQVGDSDVILEHMRVMGKEITDDQLSSTFTLFLMNVNAQANKH